MTTLRFVDQYTADAPPYEQSEEVKQVYAQSHGLAESFCSAIEVAEASQELLTESLSWHSSAFADHTFHKPY